jgi:hypothetical protein
VRWLTLAISKHLYLQFQSRKIFDANLILSCQLSTDDLIAVVRRQKVRQLLKIEIIFQCDTKQQLEILESSNGIETYTDNFKAGKFSMPI